MSILPKWSDLTNDQRSALVDAADYHCCSCVSGADVAHAVYGKLREMLNPLDDEPLNLPPHLRPPGYVAA